MKYKIELWCGDDLNGRWDRSWSYPEEYTKAEAKALINEALIYGPYDARYKWRIVSMNGIVRVPKVYRRHAAVTPLELRGAIQMLERAMDHMVQLTWADKLACIDADYYNPFMILMDAKLACKRALEAL